MNGTGRRKSQPLMVLDVDGLFASVRQSILLCLLNGLVHFPFGVCRINTVLKHNCQRLGRVHYTHVLPAEITDHQRNSDQKKYHNGTVDANNPGYRQARAVASQIH
jgi:hypothetical protein